MGITQSTEQGLGAGDNGEINDDGRRRAAVAQWWKGNDETRIFYVSGTIQLGRARLGSID